MAKKRDRKVWKLEEWEAKIHREYCPDAMKLANRLAETTGLLLKQLVDMPVEDILNFRSKHPIKQKRRSKREQWNSVLRCIFEHHYINKRPEPLTLYELEERLKIPYTTLWRRFDESEEYGRKSARSNNSKPVRVGTGRGKSGGYRVYQRQNGLPVPRGFRNKNGDIEAFE